MKEVSQYEFYMESLTVPPKHVKSTPQDEYLKGIYDLEAIKNTFKVVNIQKSSDINKIDSAESHQSSRKSRGNWSKPQP